jgi:hypothetical protein
VFKPVQSPLWASIKRARSLTQPSNIAASQKDLLGRPARHRQSYAAINIRDAGATELRSTRNGCIDKSAEVLLVSLQKNSASQGWNIISYHAMTAIPNPTIACKGVSCLD